MAGTLTPTEDQVFDTLFGWIAAVLGLADNTTQIVKGFQNQASAPLGSYVVVSPGIMQRQDFGNYQHDPDNAQIGVAAHNTYSYQVDCYGQNGPNWASMLAVAWRSHWGVDAMPTDTALTPLYADAPQQLNIVNSEGQFEQRSMIRLFGQVNQVVTLPQDYFDAVSVDSITAADTLP